MLPASIANAFVRKHHYSGKVVPNSTLHFGAFLDGHLHGVLSYGNSMVKENVIGLVEGTGWNEFLELNRMAFDEYLPRNSESYCIGATLRMIKKKAPHIKWVISFADGTQCGDGTIYRASNFVLTGINKNNTIIELPNGERITQMTLSAHPNAEPIKRCEKYLGIGGGIALQISGLHSGQKDSKAFSSDIYTFSTRAAGSGSPFPSFRLRQSTRLGQACTKGRISRKQNDMQ